MEFGSRSSTGGWQADSTIDCSKASAPFAVMQVTAPKLVDSLAAEAPQELAQLRRVFGAYATFGATRASAGGDSELDGVRMEQTL